MNNEFEDKIWSVCIKEASKAVLHDDVPIGAVIVQNGKIIAKSHNDRQKKADILGHAEINVIKKASSKLQRWNLADCDIFVTLKPCKMCEEIIKQSRINHVYYLLSKPDYKKEYNRTKFLIVNKQDSEQLYLNILTSFFKTKR